MKFSDSTNKTGIVEYIDFLVSTDSTKYPTAQKTRNINSWYRRVIAWIWKASGNWTFDDINATTLPEATTTLVDNQRDYGLPTAAGSEFGEIERVEVKDNSGNYYHLLRLEKDEVYSALTEFEKTKGKPKYYYLEANSIFLLPAPNTTTDTTASQGLKIYLERDVTEFVSTDTTLEPGFNRNWHPALAYGAALEYIIAKTPEERGKIDALRAETERIKSEIQDFYSRRTDRDSYEARRVRKQDYR